MANGGAAAIYGFVQGDSAVCPYVISLGDDGYAVVEMWRDGGVALTLIKKEELDCGRLKAMCNA